MTRWLCVLEENGYNIIRVWWWTKEIGWIKEIRLRMSVGRKMIYRTRMPKCVNLKMQQNTWTPSSPHQTFLPLSDRISSPQYYRISRLSRSSSRNTKAPVWRGLLEIEIYYPGLASSRRGHPLENHPHEALSITKPPRTPSYKEPRDTMENIQQQ